ncbi:MAG: hypothetical protein ACR2H3_14760 [Acidimicrobiales bacterium]
MNPLDLVAVAVLVLFGSRLAISFRRSLHEGARARTTQIVRGVRARHVLPVPLVIASVIGAATALVQIPGLSFGWWSALGGVGNPAFGMTETNIGNPFFDAVPLFFLVLLIPALPLLVEREEELFRLGAEEWTGFKRVWRSIWFGLVHAAVGIPVGVALALSIGGGWFTFAYLRGVRVGGTPRAGVLESARAHLAYNATIVALVTVLLVWDFIAVHVV